MLHKILIFLTLSIIINDGMTLDNHQKKFNKLVKNLTSNFKVSNIQTPELISLINKNSKIIIIDVRSSEEFQVSHIPHSIHIDQNNFSITDFKLTFPQKNNKYIIYCSVGYRSGIVAEKLKKEKYNVFNYVGGIFDWVNKGYSITSSTNNNEKKIHGYSKEWSKWINDQNRVVD